MLHSFTMEKFNINYSTKNIPQPSKHEYKIQLISKVESVIKRMRWKTLEFLGKLNTAQKETFGFVYRNCPPSVDEISGFEDALTLLIKNINKINKIVILETNVNQWKNTNSVISWFKQLRDKNRLSFVNFDVESFYPSITENLSQEAINNANDIVDISNTELSIVMQARKTLLFHDDIPWVKRSGNEEFDVPVGSYDGAEVSRVFSFE